MSKYKKNKSTSAAAKNREQSIAEIEKKIRDLRSELLQLRLRKPTGQVERPHQLQAMRRDIARLETIAREKRATAA